MINSLCGKVIVGIGKLSKVEILSHLDPKPVVSYSSDSLMVDIGPLVTLNEKLPHSNNLVAAIILERTPKAPGEMDISPFLNEKLQGFCSRVYFNDKRDILVSRLSNPKRDEEFVVLSEANETLLALDDEVMTVSNLLMDMYTKRFPEMNSLSLSQLDYAKTVLAIGDTVDLTKVDYSTILPPTIVLAMSMPASTSLGKPLSTQELVDVVFLAKTVIAMFELRRKLLEFLESRMSQIAPNITAIVGTKIASQLLGSIGSVADLAKIPAGNIMVIGRQRRELAGFSLSHVNPHAGYIYTADLVINSPPQYKTQAQRLISNKIALAARVDSQTQSPDGEYGRKLRQEIITKLEKLIEPAPMNQVKPIPPPPIESSKKRGGRRARKQKELYAQTEIRKLTNRIGFGKAEEEIIVGSNVVGLGELSSSTTVGRGMKRTPVLDNKLRDYIKKQSQKAYAGASFSNTRAGVLTSISEPPIAGTATSMTITNSEGIRLETVMNDTDNVASRQQSRYIGSNMSFRKT